MYIISLGKMAIALVSEYCIFTIHGYINLNKCMMVNLYVFMCTYCYRDSMYVTNNPVYSDNVEVTKVTPPPESDHGEHIYDAIPAGIYSEFQSYCSTLKSASGPHDESSMPNESKESTAHTNRRNKPNSLHKPKYANTSATMPAAKAHHNLPTNESPLPEDEYLLPDIKFVVENQYTSLNEARRAEKNLYASHYETQPMVYEEPVNQPSSPSNNTIPKKFPGTD